ncbi:hypothetical protein QBC47DRAFT_439776 [Echria macrotheca]|uniref:NmrA-like domain-containing protein n=1 Tax=Echria macrotheca TaxID=438768 RepID=A0AAJ0F054_9PEZI|nr:hypothetical protein QBC47DRAFT_439776 [Echria macrotheca]
MQNPKILAVTGATGAQGGGVVNVMKKVPGWKVRAITRNTTSDAAQNLAAEGIEVVQASFDDETSLAKAFEGAHAVYAVTNFWEHYFRGKTLRESGTIEEAQGMTIARAAADTPTLEHFIWSTEPSAAKVTNGQIVTPHLDHKANNMAYVPAMKPVLHPGNGQWIQVLPTKPDAKILLSGDMAVNPGIWVRQVLANGSKTFGKYANVALEKWSFQQMVEVWGEVLGRNAVFMRGEMGTEMAQQFKFGEICDPWKETEEFLSSAALGIDEKEVVGFRGTIESLKHLF